MPLPVWLPKFDPANEESRLLRWLVAEGEAVMAGDPVCEVETDKVNMEIEAPADGWMGPQRFPADSVVPAATVVAWVLREDERGQELPDWPEARESDAARLPPAPAPAQNAVSHERAGAEAGLNASPVARRVRATPAARHQARIRRIDLAGLKGSGPRGRVQADDVHQAGQQTWPAGTVRLEVLVDMTALLDLRRTWPVAADAPSPLALLVRACALTMSAHPALKATLRAGHYERIESVRAGVVIPGHDDEMLAVLEDVEDLDMPAFLQRYDDLVRRAQGKGLAARERAGACIRICDLGAFGIHRVSPRIVPPAVASLGLGRIGRGFLPDETGSTAARPAATLGLTLAGGPGAPAEIEGARFLRDLCAMLERPLGLLLQGGSDADRHRM